MHLDTPRQIVSRPAGYPNSIFREGLTLKAGYAQMNDWSRLAVDPAGCKNSRPKTNCTNTDTLAIRPHRARPVSKRELTKPPSGGRSGQLRLSLTNTYHEWPVIFGITGPICARVLKSKIRPKLGPRGHHDWPVMRVTRAESQIDGEKWR